MSKLKTIYGGVLCASLFCIAAQAQTINISPSSPAVYTGGLLQFTAQTGGLAAGVTVNWYAGGVLGGNAASGTISNAGLYTGPANIPSGGAVRITATASDGSVSVKTTATIVGAPASGGSSGGSSGGGSSSNAPVITSVTPNPLGVGTYTLTIQGTGFQPGALVYDSYGAQSNIQYASMSVTPTTVTASIYQGSATSSTFCVKNPGTACSNSITVPVTGSSSGGSSGGAGTGGGSTPTAPVLTSVTPSPLGVGTYTVTLQGTGFQAGALVYDSYGSQSDIQYASMSVTSTTVTASIYQGSATSSTFCVKNPGSACSNSITVPVTGTSTSGGGNGGNTTYTLTVVNGTGGGSFAAGASVSICAGTPPAGETFQSWTGTPVANAQLASTSLTMPAANITVTANFYTPAPVNYPVTTHPRLWITQQDLPHLQAWATPSNQAYQGQSGPLYTAIGYYNQAFPGAALNAPNPTPASPYPDFGDSQGYTGILSEECAVMLAFNSLIDPSPANRAQYAQAARNFLMYAMNKAALGHATGLPFRDPSFAIYNRASFTGHEWPLIVDWIYPTLSAADKATIRSVFLMWANDCLTAETTGGDNPGAQGLENSLALLPDNKPYRMASNNYFLAHARLLTMMSLVLDPADDTPVNPALPAAALGNTVRSYLPDATGSWLYEEFAMMGDPVTVAQAYGVPNNPTGTGFGLASGGLPPEGMLYGESFAYMLGQLLALQTAGFNDPKLSGPQIGLIGAPVWDRYVTGYLSSLTPTPMIPAAESYLGSVYQYAGYGDMLRLYVTQDQMAPWALLGLLDRQTGVSTHVNAARWFSLNAMPNGASGLLARMADPWTWGVTQDLLYYMLLDPTAPAPTDPRPGFPNVFYDAPQGRIIAHTDWTPNGTMFDYKAGWISINHQDGNGGMFELFRKGEWLTKEMSNYDDNGLGQTSTYHNTMALQNWCPPCATITWQAQDAPVYANGSQWLLGADAGDSTTTTSSGPGYVYATSDLTNLYNRPNTWVAADTVADITQATRSILWLNGDYVVVYDRATSMHNGFKRFNLSLSTNPAIAGNTATETLASGQQLFIQTLLPLTPSLTSYNGAANLSTLADLEPTKYIYQVQDATNPLDTRFLHVLQGADPGAKMVAATYLQSSGGTAFDGAMFGSSEVWFPVSTANAFGGATFTVSAGVHTMLITGLTPNAAYTATVTGNAVSVFPGGLTTADAGGVLVVTF